MKLKEIRTQRGLSQNRVAADMNLSPVVYGRYENGQREPSFIVLSALADYFGVTVDEILGRPSHSDADQVSKPKSQESRIISDCVDKMPPKDRERALNLLKAVYADYFENAEKKMA